MFYKVRSLFIASFISFALLQPCLSVEIQPGYLINAFGSTFKKCPEVIEVYTNNKDTIKLVGQPSCIAKSINFTILRPPGLAGQCIKFDNKNNCLQTESVGVIPGRVLVKSKDKDMAPFTLVVPFNTSFEVNIQDNVSIVNNSLVINLTKLSLDGASIEGEKLYYTKKALDKTDEAGIADSIEVDNLGAFRARDLYTNDQGDLIAEFPLPRKELSEDLLTIWFNKYDEELSRGTSFYFHF